MRRVLLAAHVVDGLEERHQQVERRDEDEEHGGRVAQKQRGHDDDREQRYRQAPIKPHGLFVDVVGIERVVHLAADDVGVVVVREHLFIPRLVFGMVAVFAHALVVHGLGALGLVRVAGEDERVARHAQNVEVVDLAELVRHAAVFVGRARYLEPHEEERDGDGRDDEVAVFVHEVDDPGDGEIRHDEQYGGHDAQIEPQTPQPAGAVEPVVAGAQEIRVLAQVRLFQDPVHTSILAKAAGWHGAIARPVPRLHGFSCTSWVLAKNYWAFAPRIATCA